MTLREGPWATYEPTAADPWDLRKVAHLHRRAGFGATWPELQRDLKAGPAASIDRFLKPREPTADEKSIPDALRSGALRDNDSERLKAWWLYRVLYDPDLLREKLTLFWHSHFATSNRKVGSVALMLRQNQLLRKHALGDFAALLNGIVHDQAMLVWLDGAGSRKEKPNENFAREFLELFTVGLGHYTEKDIREAARAFTGWTRKSEDAANADAENFGFDAKRFDDGVKTFLSQKGSWKPADIVRITLEQPACAEFVCRKLYHWLVSEKDEPAEELIQPLAQEFRGSRYSIRRVVEVILRSRHFFARSTNRQRIKSPVEFSAGLLRMLMLTVPPVHYAILALAATCERQGQDLFYPPNVKGWDGGRTWLTSTALLERGNWSSDVVWGNDDLGMRPLDPIVWADVQRLAPGGVVQAWLDLLLQGDLTAKARGLVMSTASDGKPDSLRKALQLILHCPEFQLA
jgi:uncharacterized protein (DUF1800 family)